jgi:hypothetical protein
MNIASKKIELIEWLTKIEDISLLDQVEDLKNKNVVDKYAFKLKPMSPQQYSEMLDQAEDDFKNGRVTSQIDLEKESENW